MKMTSDAPGLSALLPVWQRRVEDALDRWLPPATRLPARLHQAMRYATLSGGKRIRPVLVYATGLATDQPADTLDGAACAVELIHAYSLIHDDLPCMDDDDLRRGQPTCHRAFDEATAVLAGDALQALAFRVLAHDEALTGDAAARLDMVRVLAEAAGASGMVGGQAMDLDATGRELTVAELEAMHIHKTGALIRACVQLACRNRPGLDADTCRHLDHYAKCIGLAFQIRDDILDVEGETATLGKQAGADRALDKPTFPALLGLEAARARARELHDEALAALDGLGTAAQPLRDLAGYIIDRDR